MLAAFLLSVLTFAGSVAPLPVAVPVTTVQGPHR
jgi:hypothetical protein